jgi:multidrug efflux pump subunit AcrA (membrane-fusion protein)
VDIERLRRAQAAGSITMARGKEVSVQLTLPDGAPYAHNGTLDFLDVSVDPATGAVALRGIIPNPDHQLLPGMFVGVRLTSGEVNRGFLVPQAGLLRDASGPYVLVAGPDNKVVQKPVTAESLEGPRRSLQPRRLRMHRRRQTSPRPPARRRTESHAAVLHRPPGVCLGARHTYCVGWHAGVAAVVE